MEKIEVKKFERDGVLFSSFTRNGKTFLCTGNPTGRIELAYIGEIADYYEVIGATSVVSGVNATVDELYNEWLDRTAFWRSVGAKY